MSKTINALTGVLAGFDQKIEPLSESDVSKAVYLVRDQEDAAEFAMQWVAEAIAFDFCEDYQNQATGWGTYYGPMFVSSNEDGTAIESPSIKKVTKEMIEYWTERAKITKHPVLRARYADLVWDFNKVVTNEPPHYSIAHIVIDSIIEISQGNHHTRKTSIIKKLKRALNLAILLNDSSRAERIRDAIIDYEDSITQDSKLGLGGFAYDFLFENDRVELTGEQKQKIINDLEGHLLRASQSANKKEIDPWAVEKAALRLAKYYRKVGRDEDTKRVIIAMGDTFIQASSEAAALQASAWLQRVHATYKEFGLTDEAEEISIKLREIGEKAKSELKPISHTMEIPKKEMEAYIAALTDGEIDDVLTRITAHYIPKKSEVEKQLKELAGEAPLMFLIPMGILDNMGRPLAKVGSLEEDLEGHIVKQMSQNMNISSIFLSQVLETLVKKHPTFEKLYIDYLFRSPIFKEDRKSIIEQGVREYLNKNHMVAVHLLIPQIENALRVLLEKAGGSVLKPARDGGYNLKVLYDILCDPVLVQVFGEDIVFYFRALLVDPRGWNLRNIVCHGLCDISEFGPSMSDRIIHVLLCLALVREKGKEQAKE